MDKRLYFVAMETESSRLTIFLIDIRDGTMLLSEKMSRRGAATHLKAELPIETITRIDEQIVFYHKSTEFIERTLIAALASFSKAEACYANEDLAPIDIRWREETEEVLSCLKKI